MQIEENELVKFDFQQTNVNVIMIDDEPWFMAKEVAEILGYSNSRTAIADNVEAGDVQIILMSVAVGNPRRMIINEFGLYSLILSSKLPEARIFKHWVTHEVLPSLRKTGSYSLSKAPEAELLREIQKLNEINQALNEINERTNQKLDILIKQNEQKKIKKQLPKEPLPDDEKAMIISAICDLAQKNQKVKVSYSTFRNILVSKFGKDVLPPHPTRDLIALAPELEEKKIRLERVGKGLKEQSKSMVQGGFIICS